MVLLFSFWPKLRVNTISRNYTSPMKDKLIFQKNHFRSSFTLIIGNIIIALRWRRQNTSTTGEKGRSWKELQRTCSQAASQIWKCRLQRPSDTNLHSWWIVLMKTMYYLVICDKRVYLIRTKLLNRNKIICSN